MMKAITMDQLWAAFAARGLLPDDLETPAEVSLQKVAFCCGAVAALGEMAMGRLLDVDTAADFLLDACAGLQMQVDSELAREPYVAASDN